MFNRKPSPQNAEDAEASIAPWEMLDEDGISSYTARVRERDPQRNLTAFARRIDQDTVACFDKGEDGKSKAVVVLHREGEPAQAMEHRYPGFSAWFDDVLAASRLWQSSR